MNALTNDGQNLENTAVDLKSNPYRMFWHANETPLQWNLSVTTNSILKTITSDLFSNVF